MAVTQLRGINPTRGRHGNSAPRSIIHDRTAFAVRLAGYDTQFVNGIAELIRLASLDQLHDRVLVIYSGSNQPLFFR